MCKINNSNSDLLPVKSGVPQGSVLGHLLFLFTYINDLPLSVQFSTIFMFVAILSVPATLLDLDNMTTYILTPLNVLTLNLSN